VKRGLFITFEGIDGCGKSTQLARAQEYCRSRKLPILVTREPGGTAISEKIRELLLNPEHHAMVDECELLLYFAARAQHVAEKIRPTLKAGTVVLCDRFSEATFAYQGFGRGVDLHLLSQVNEFATAGLSPDLTFVFDVAVEVAHHRMQATGRAPDRLESAAIDFHQRVREGYLTLAANNPERIVLIDAEHPVDEISVVVCDTLERYLKGGGWQE
jgi:dTMP kinase